MMMAKIMIVKLKKKKEEKKTKKKKNLLIYFCEMVINQSLQSSMLRYNASKNAYTTDCSMTASLYLLKRGDVV